MVFFIFIAVSGSPYQIKCHTSKITFFKVLLILLIFDCFSNGIHIAKCDITPLIFNLLQFQESLVYIICSMPVRATQWDLVSRKGGEIDI